MMMTIIIIIIITIIIAVNVGALELIKKGMDQNLGKTPRAINVNELPKIILLVLETARIPRRFLSRPKFTASSTKFKDTFKR